MKLQALGNIYFWINRFCNPDDIVVFLDADDYLVGSQALKIINSKYVDPNIWVVYSRLFDTPNIWKNLKLGTTTKMSVPPNKYRNFLGHW
jgi:hypothetical protein